MMMTMYSLHCASSPLSLPSSADNGCTTRLNGYHVDGADGCLIGIILGVTMKNITQQQY